MKENISPEEKLLRLIKQENKAPASIRKGFKSRLLNLKPRYLAHTYLNRLIPVLIILSLAYFVVNLVYPLFNFKQVKLTDFPKEKINLPQLGQKEELKPYEFYLEGVKERQVFSSAAASPNVTSAGVINADITKDITLVGIISGDTPQAIIEDKKTRKTYYATKGQFIGDFQIEDISEGKVVLNYSGQRYELYL